MSGSLWADGRGGKQKQASGLVRDIPRLFFFPLFVASVAEVLLFVVATLTQNITDILPVAS